MVVFKRHVAKRQTDRPPIDDMSVVTYDEFKSAFRSAVKSQSREDWAYVAVIASELSYEVPPMTCLFQLWLLLNGKLGARLRESRLWSRLAARLRALDKKVKFQAIKKLKERGYKYPL